MEGKRVRSTWACPQCGGPMYKVGSAKTDGTIIIRWRRCKACGFKTRELSVLLAPQVVRPLK